MKSRFLLQYQLFITNLWPHKYQVQIVELIPLSDYIEPQLTLVFIFLIFQSIQKSNQIFWKVAIKILVRFVDWFFCSFFFFFLRAPAMLMWQWVKEIRVLGHLWWKGVSQKYTIKKCTTLETATKICISLNVFKANQRSSQN